MAFRIDETYRLAFPALIFERRLTGVEELEDGLKDAVLGRRMTSEGLTRSNEGAWHSENDLFKWDEPEAQALIKKLRAALKEYWAVAQGRLVPGPDGKPQVPRDVKILMQLEGWAMVYERGDWSKPHAHPNAHISGVYFLQAGTDAPGRPHSGQLTLLDPRHRPGMFQTDGWHEPDALSIIPEDRLLVLFPSWMVHYAHPYWGAGERIALAFNASVHRVADGASARDPGEPGTDEPRAIHDDEAIGSAAFGNELANDHATR